MGTRRVLLSDNDQDLLEKKRKSHEMSECCVGMGSSNSIKEQQLLEAAAFHLILLSNPLQQSSYDDDHNYSNKGYDSDGHCRVITGKKKKTRKDYGVELGIVKHNNDKDANLVASSSSSSSSSSFNQTIKSGISSVSILEENANEGEDNEGKAPRLQRHRSRSIVDIYLHSTMRL